MNKQEKELVKELENEFGKKNIVIDDDNIKVNCNDNKFGIFGNIIYKYITTSDINYTFEYIDVCNDDLGTKLDELLKQELKFRAARKTNEKFIEKSKELFRTMNKEDEFRLFHPNEKTTVKVDLDKKIIEVVK